MESIYWSRSSVQRGVRPSSLGFPSIEMEMRTCSRLETVQPWSSCLRFKSPQRFHDNCSLFVRWLVCAKGELNVRGWNDNSKMTMTAHMHALSNYGIMLLCYSTSCGPKWSMNWVKRKGNGHFPTLSSFFKSAWVYMCESVCMHAWTRKKQRFL